MNAGRHGRRAAVFAMALGVLAVAAGARGQSLATALLGRSKQFPPERRFIKTIVVRDGVEMATMVTLPEGNGPWPVILTRTPYGKESVGVTGALFDFTEKGYVHVMQDARGTGKSGGRFGDFHMEKSDGVDTIAWIAKQPWCDGAVGMFGVSAGGIMANCAAMGNPPALKCIFVAVAHGSSFRYGSYSGGIFLLDNNERWFKSLGHPLPAGPRPRIAVYDDKEASIDMAQHYGQVNVPAYNVVGWFDCFGESGVENFELLQSMGGPGARGSQKLVVGAFGHFILGGKLRYPRDASGPKFDDVDAWFDHWLKKKKSAIVERPSARYFVMGDPLDPKAPGNEWRETNEWPPRSEETPLWLAANGSLVRSAPTDESGVTYEADPKNPVPTIGGNNLFLARGPMDQRPLRSRPDVVRFETEALDSPLEVVGRVFADLVVSTDGPDTDFIVKLVDIYPDGYEALVLDAGLRLRYREGFTKPARAEPGKAYPIRVNLGTTALVVNKGHRLAVHVQSANNPRFEPHTNTWDPVPSYADGRVAKNTIHLGPKGSRIVLPVVSETKVAGR